MPCPQQQNTPVGNRKRKRRKLKDSDLSDLLSPDSPLFRAKRKSGDLLSVSGSLLENSLVSPATPKGKEGFQWDFFVWQHHYCASKGENTRFSISYLKCVGISYERTLGKTTLINKPCQLGTMKSHVPCDLFFFVDTPSGTISPLSTPIPGPPKPLTSRQQVAMELLQTEKNYVEILTNIFKVSTSYPSHFQYLICNSPYCLPYNSYYISLENLVLNQLTVC